MIPDALVAFVPIGGNLSLVAGAGVPIASNVIDLLGNGVGVAPVNIYGNTTVFGQPGGSGIGKVRPELNVTVGTALAAAAGTTLKAALQGAPDPGAAGNYTPATGDWQDFASQDNITVAQGAANTVILRVPYLPPFPANMRPRFLRLLFSPQLNGLTPGGLFTAGTIASALVVWGRDDQANKFAARNYSVA